MHLATTELARQLDMLYGLYTLALDLCQSISMEEPELMNKRLIERQRLVRKTETIALEAQVALRKYETLSVPANEKALISEKRQMILDILGRTCDAENAVLRSMYQRMVVVRQELVRMDTSKRAIAAYQKTPAYA
jgi:hypothetical protein